MLSIHIDYPEFSFIYNGGQSDSGTKVKNDPFELPINIDDHDSETFEETKRKRKSYNWYLGCQKKWPSEKMLGLSIVVEKGHPHLQLSVSSIIVNK